MIFLTKFLASKSVTVVLLVVIIGMGVLYFFEYKELQKANSIIQDQEQTIADKNAIISGYKSKVAFLQDTMKEKDSLIERYSAKVNELNKQYLSVQERLGNIQAVNTVLRSKLNKLNNTEMPADVGEAIRKSNEILNTFVFD